MTNNINKLFSRFLAIAFLFTVFTAASYAQAKANLYFQQGGGFYGQIVAYNGSHWEIYTSGTVIKTFKNSCRFVSGNGVLCTFGQFKDGRHIYSGQGYFFQNGSVHLKWTNENVGGTWRNINSAWVVLIPR